MKIEHNSADSPRTGHETTAGGEINHNRGNPRIEEQPARAVHEKKAQTLPPIMPGAQVRRMTAALGRECCRDSAHSHPEKPSLNPHQAGEFHAGRTDVHAFVAVFSEGPKAAVKVSRGRTEEEPPDGGEHRIAEIAMKWRHSSIADPSEKAVAHDQVGAISQLLD